MGLRALVLVVCCLLCACNKKPGSTTPPPGDRITGAERLGWDQQAGDANELATFRYAVYVDGVRSELTDVTCVPAASAFGCTARLPAMSVGMHTLELASFVSDVGVIESSKSAPLRVQVGATAAGRDDPAALESPEAAAFTRTDGAVVATEFLVDGLSAPTDLAFAPDGRILVAERGGAVRVVRDGALDSGAALVDDVDVRGGGGLLAMALAPQFARTHHVYVVHTAADRDDRVVFRVARYREVNGTLGERAVLLDGIPAPSVDPRALLRFGPDGMLYIAFDDGGADGAGRNASSYNGKLLRLTPDGATPRDQASPVIGYGFRSPRGLAWSPVTGQLWVADVRSDGSERLIAGANSYDLPVRAELASMAFAGAGLIVAGSESMLQLRVTAEAIGLDTRMTLNETLTPLRVVAVGPDGDIYFCTNSALGRIGL